MVLLLGSMPVAGLDGRPQPGPLTPAEAQALVQRALATEVRLATDPAHPMRFRLHRQSPRLATTKDIVETRDGAVAHLLAINDRPLDPAAQAQEEARLDQLERDPSLQQHRKRNEEGDAGIILKILRMMPSAFLFEYQGVGQAPAGSVHRFTYRPNPRFQPPDMETQALTAMTGELWVDVGAERVTRLTGSLGQDTSYGWGILGKLSKGGWLELDQAEVEPHIWRVSHVQINMTLRIVFKTKVIDTNEQMRDYTPVPVGMDYRTAIRMLRGK